MIATLVMAACAGWVVTAVIESMMGPPGAPIDPSILSPSDDATLGAAYACVDTGVAQQFWGAVPGCATPDHSAAPPDDGSPRPLMTPTPLDAFSAAPGPVVVLRVPHGVATAAVIAAAPILADAWGVETVAAERIGPGVVAATLVCRDPLAGVRGPAWGGAA